MSVAQIGKKEFLSFGQQWLVLHHFDLELIKVFSFFCHLVWFLIHFIGFFFWSKIFNTHWWPRWSLEFWLHSKAKKRVNTFWGNTIPYFDWSQIHIFNHFLPIDFCFLFNVISMSFSRWQQHGKCLFVPPSSPNKKVLLLLSFSWLIFFFSSFHSNSISGARVGIDRNRCSDWILITFFCISELDSNFISLSVANWGIPIAAITDIVNKGPDVISGKMTAGQFSI